MRHDIGKLSRMLAWRAEGAFSAGDCALGCLQRDASHALDELEDDLFEAEVWHWLDRSET